MRNVLRKALILICGIVMTICGWKIFSYYREVHDAKSDNSRLIAEIKKNDDSVTDEDIPKETEFIPDATTYSTLHSINPDYFMWVRWDSGIISQPIMRPSNNEYYLTHNVYGNEALGGAAFIDAANSPDDQNITIYGHSVFLANTISSNMVFSAMRGLLNQATFENNQTFKLYKENVIEEYEVITVSLIDISKDDWQYIQANFSDEDYPQWTDHAKATSSIQSGVDFQTDDRLVTFQTCMYLDSTERIVVIGRKTGERSYSY